MKTLAVLAAIMMTAFPALGSGYISGIGNGATGDVVSPGMTASLPDTVFVVEGVELNIYDNQLPAHPFGFYPFNIMFACDVGVQKERSLQWTPTTDSSEVLTINAVMPDGSIGEVSTVSLEAIVATSGDADEVVIFVGDSMLDQGASLPVIVSEVDSLFSNDAGGSIIPLGSQVSNGYYYEAYGGWNWNRFTTDYIALPDSNRFWDFNTTDSRLDFQAYSDGYIGGADIDAMVIHLGGNDVLVPSLAGTRLSSTEIGVFIASATAFLDALASATYGYPDCKVLIMLPSNGSAWKSAWGVDYVANLSTFIYNHRLLVNAYVEAFDGGNYSSNVDVVASNLWVDNLEGYPHASAAYSDRVTTTLDYGENFLHPDTDGREQMADAVYSHLKHSLIPPTGVNQLDDSWDVDNASTCWNVNPTFFVTTGSQAGHNGSDAVLVESVGASAGPNLYNIGPYTISDDDATLSLFIKNDDLGVTTTLWLNLYDETAATQHRISFTFDAGGATVYDSDTAIDGYSVGTDLGGGWYRVYLTLDLATRGIVGHEFSARLYPFGVSISAGLGCVVDGMQLEYGVLTPGGYQKKNCP